MSLRVTWLLPIKDGMPFLPETLASIEAQTYQDWEVLAWDNGSTDGTIQELKRWIPSRLPGRVVTDCPLGLGLSLAQMVLRADTELCALPNGVANFPFTAAALPVTQTARAAAPSQVSVANCTAVSGLPISGASQTLASETNAFSSASPANIGHDLELVLKPLAAASGGSPTQVTVTYTLTAN